MDSYHIGVALALVGGILFLYIPCLIGKIIKKGMGDY